MTNYDLDPLNTPPWWPGLVALVVLAAIILSIIFNY